MHPCQAQRCISILILLRFSRFTLHLGSSDLLCFHCTFFCGKNRHGRCPCCCHHGKSQYSGQNPGRYIFSFHFLNPPSFSFIYQKLVFANSQSKNSHYQIPIHRYKKSRNTALMAVNHNSFPFNFPETPQWIFPFGQMPVHF